MVEKEIFCKYWSDITPTIKSDKKIIITSTPKGLSWISDYWMPSLFDDTQNKIELRKKKLDSL